MQNYKTTLYFNNATINFANFSVCCVFIGTLTYRKTSNHNYFYKVIFVKNFNF